jgi:hypothetical protein
MREFKKSFLPTLLQLSILVYFLRHSTRLGSDLTATTIASTAAVAGFNRIGFDYFYLNLPVSISHHEDSLHGELDLLRLNFNSLSNQDSTSSRIINQYTNGNYLPKETRQYLNDLGVLNLINKINQTAELGQNNSNPLNSNFNFHQRIFIAPASFSESAPNPKDSRDLSETRLLLNSIELNWNNQLTKEVNCYLFNLELLIKLILFLFFY